MISHISRARTRPSRNDFSPLYSSPIIPSAAYTTKISYNIRFQSFTVTVSICHNARPVAPRFPQYYIIIVVRDVSRPAREQPVADWKTHLSLNYVSSLEKKGLVVLSLHFNPLNVYLIYFSFRQHLLCQNPEMTIYFVVHYIIFRLQLFMYAPVLYGVYTLNTLNLNSFFNDLHDFTHNAFSC